MAPGPYVVLHAHDTGHGMSPDTQRRIFEPFFTTKAPGKGTGLGLSMVFGTVKQSGGFIFVESEEGKGTTFSLYFPPAPRPLDGPAASEGGRDVVASGSPANTSAPLPKIRSHGETVLVVEDEESIRNLVVSSLRRDGYVLLVAASGAEAIRVAAAHTGRIDLLLTDAMMPGVTGLELAHTLVAARPGLRVIVMSGYTSDILGLTDLNGRSSMLQKPFTPRDLRQSVRDALAANPSAI